MTRFPVPDATALNPHGTSLMERKSRFLTRSCRCVNANEAKDFVAATRATFPDATHHCHAFLTGSPGDASHSGCSDDGEPRGTAGKPMLRVLLHSGVGQICVVVTRWFGGVKLGVGGLVRAYQTSVKVNLESLPLRENRAFESWKIVADYAAANRLTRLLPKIEASVEKIDYREGAEVVINLPVDRVEDLTETVGRVAGFAATLEKIDAKIL